MAKLEFFFRKAAAMSKLEFFFDEHSLETLNDLDRRGIKYKKIICRDKVTGRLKTLVIPKLKGGGDG
jgi:hypothetical protein